MRFPDDSIENLCGLGYTESEARFLYIVATHSGYFSTRQFLNFTGTQSGDRSMAFSQKVLGKGHASARLLLRNGRVYHLFSRIIYRAIGRENLRNRREHGVEHIRSRLVILDFVLSHLDCNYLETEHDKLGYFCRQLSVPKQLLPAKTYRGAIDEHTTERYFVDKFPMFFHPHPAPPPVVTFTFIDPGYATLANFDTHLLTYAGLFRMVPTVQLVYVAIRPTHFEAARKMFLSRVDQPPEIDSGEEVLTYFRLRKLWETKQFAKLDTHGVIRLNQYTERFAGDPYEKHYPAWRDLQVSDAMVSSFFRDLTPQRKVGFEAELVDGQAALFEAKTRPGLARQTRTRLKSPIPHTFTTPFSSDFADEEAQSRQAPED
jgi:hypothetical protein